MNTLLIIILFFVSISLLLFFIRKWMKDLEERSKPSQEVVAWLQDMGRRLDQSTSSVDTKLTTTMSQFNERLDKATFVMGEVQKKIGEFSEIGRGMKELQDFLQSPKLRGNIGEQVLKELLSQFLPQETYMLQYKFKNGETCDAIIHTSQGLVPVDSKFPFENFRNMIKEEASAGKERYKTAFRQDVRKHITDIFKKYILVEEGTVDYALMYIPSEAIYYEIINDGELYDFASSKRIIMVSPMSFYAYLKVILMSFEGQKIEKRAKEIMRILQSLNKDYAKADEALQLLNRHVTNAYNQTTNVSKLFSSVGQKLTASKMLEGEEPKKLEE